MSNTQKLYSYYFINLFRKNGIKITLLTLITTFGTWFALSFGTFKTIKAIGEVKINKQVVEEIKLDTSEIDKAFKSYPNLLQFGMHNKNAKLSRELMIKLEKNLGENLEKAKQTGDQDKINGAKMWLQGSKGVNAGLSTLFGSPCKNWEVNDFFLNVEGRNKGVELWRLINNLGWGTLGTGMITFSWLTLSILDFLFLRPKRDGEEALVLNFTPGVKRRDLLISKILAFLTYFALFSLVSFVVPCLIHHLGIGSFASVGKLLGLFGYLLVVAPLLIFGLLLLPYILLGSGSPTLASLFPGLMIGFSMLGGGLKFFSTWRLPHTIENLFFHPLVFTASALTVGTLCFTTYYWQSQSEDLKG